ncbi:uncharacterized protein LOC128557262 [Mercenaria mercenaria]|uniref:uncharacterized protein LOC128557262 n=1 Tax=Mercenaria mercenaria TaxID=6596 RepID=UPI00234F5CCB|nr:uncharacterized protein LOC128557262 [Mercenaria mercenaria]
MAVPGKKTLATASTSSDEDLQVYCQPCDEEGPRRPAYGYCTDCQEHLCETCFKVHKKHKLSKHHILLDNESMPKTLQLSSTSDHTSMSADFRTPCPKHKREMIKFYCHDHKTLLCSVCVTLEHTVTSCKVNYIPDISAKVINSKEYHDILKVIDNITDQCHKMLEDVKKMTGNSNSSLADVLADIKTFRKEINQRLDELERQVEDAAKAIQQENAKNLKTTETTCDDVTKSLKTMFDSIKHLNTSKQADRLFMELKSAEKMIRYYENTIQHISAYDVEEYNFKPNEIISTLLETSLGTLTKKTNKQTRPPPTSTSVKSRNTSHQGEICVKSSNDESRCYITGMILLTPDLLIITDKTNKAIKMVDTRSQSVTDKLQLDTEPSKVSSVTSTELAVTLTNKKNIQFISASSKKLTKKHTLNVDGECFGISCHEKKLVVTYLRPAKLQILDTNGTILTTIRGENIFTNPTFVTTNSSSIYVSDWNMKSIMRLNWQGEVIGRYKGMDEPKGIILSDDETVFACDQHRNVIEEISGDLSKGKVVLKDLKSPFALCWCAQTKKLYFSCFFTDTRYDNYLQIFRLS